MGVFYLVLSALLETLLVAFGALAVVFIFGRCFELVRKDRGKNTLAVVIMLLLSPIAHIKFGLPDFWVKYSLYTLSDWFNFGFSVASVFLGSVIIYVTICWRFYDRVVGLLDKVLPSKKKK